MKVVGLVASIGICTSTSGDAQQSNPVKAEGLTNGNPSFDRFFDQKGFQSMFPDAVALYNFDNLVSAANVYPEFANTGNDVNDKRELAAFLAQTAYESNYFKDTEEIERDTFSVEQYCDKITYPCAPGRRYHGRGPIQLSWNYNYFMAGKALGIDLLNNPDIVATDSNVAYFGCG
ncbi:acidic chitinase [Plasmopara halstedii]|uniref:Acidic chitinase n=1 Tax=Plasmopara halstedii TaxID=4781 RepID=A0A0P1AEC0_PLAHL|nr:acidic chitinase [Plasmopara halstedii]CEG39205.1 acidic chitinase [Plasmopara halstedii]|eukprot:XP_024575574.1 acidic chitinase [Plasmopara halstedii]